MIKSLTAFLLTVLMLTSCATTESSQNDSEGTDDSEQEEVTDTDSAPGWYNHAQRSETDSTSFYGSGMAASPDSSSAAEKASSQAMAHLKYAIDSFAEEIRRELAEGDAGGTYSDEQFIISLRKAVNNVEISEDELETEFKHVEYGDSIHRVYSRVKFTRSEAIEKLRGAVSDENFSRSLSGDVL
ncbi:MAG: hypothetical protein R6V27_01565 [Balneolaceae bacterium]